MVGEKGAYVVGAKLKEGTLGVENLEVAKEAAGVCVARAFKDRAGLGNRAVAELDGLAVGARECLVGACEFASKRHRNACLLKARTSKASLCGENLTLPTVENGKRHREERNYTAL